MLQRIQLVITLRLVLSVGVLAQQWSSTAREQHDTIRALRSHIASLTSELREGRETAGAPPEPVEHIVVAVGDRLLLEDLAGYNFKETVEVMRDGQVLLPDVGWMKVAGKTREELEQLLTKTYSAYYETVDVKVIVTSGG